MLVSFRKSNLAKNKLSLHSSCSRGIPFAKDRAQPTHSGVFLGFRHLIKHILCQALIAIALTAAAILRTKSTEEKQDKGGGKIRGPGGKNFQISVGLKEFACGKPKKSPVGDFSSVPMLCDVAISVACDTYVAATSVACNRLHKCGSSIHTTRFVLYFLHSRCGRSL